MSQDSLSSQIHQQIPPERDMRITAAETDDVVILSGTVPTQEDRAEAERAAAALSPGKRIKNLLEVERTLPQDRVEVTDDVLGTERLYDDSSSALESDLGSPNLEFTGQPLTSDVLQAEDAGVEEDEPGGEVEPDPIFFAPTDPVFATDEEGNIDVLGGFETDSMEDLGVARSAEDNTPGDEALVTAIHQELREDAATTDLRIDVVVERGVAYLRGHVPALEDAENAEAIANRVPGVREVIEALDVAQM
jgi:osmotically-inducible protein OsmY